MTLNCCKVEFSRNFAWFRVFGRLQHGTLSFARWRYQHFSVTVLHNAVARLLSVSYGLSCYSLIGQYCASVKYTCVSSIYVEFVQL